MPSSPPSKEKAQKSHAKNSDFGFTHDYTEESIRKKVATLRALLSSTEQPAVDRFIERIRYPVSAYYAHLRVHDTIPDAKEQKRYLNKLTNSCSRLNKLTSEVSELLDEVPFELRQQATKAKTPIHQVQANLTAMILAINDMTPSKSKYRPEIQNVVRGIAEAFREELHIEPIAKAFREGSDIPADAPAGERFVPILAELLNITVDRAYRIAKKEIVPS